jgi:ubiquinone/menaquinone biosynthesis C-methylase UbiE
VIGDGPMREAEMQSTDTVFAGSIPALYDRHLGPALFTPYAQNLARRLAPLTSGSLLELAAGTGRVTRELASALPAAVAITATDLNQAMLDFAVTQPTARPVTWRQADALALPFADAEFDAVICQFGVMFFPDKVAGFREARRVMKPGGSLLFSVWDRAEANALSQATADALAALFPVDPPLFIVRTPHGYHDRAAVERDVRAAGFATVEIETVTLTSRLPSAADMAIGLCQGSPLRNEIEARRPGELAAVTEAITRAIAARFGSGPIAGQMQAHVITAR